MSIYASSEGKVKLARKALELINNSASPTFTRLKEYVEPKQMMDTRYGIPGYMTVDELAVYVQLKGGQRMAVIEQTLEELKKRKEGGVNPYSDGVKQLSFMNIHGGLIEGMGGGYRKKRKLRRKSTRRKSTRRKSTRRKSTRRKSTKRRRR